MKFFLLSPWLFWVSTLSAQIGNNFFAPDFTMTDLTGATHHLYPVLEQDKTVLIMTGATWNAACWQYHNSGVLNTLYQQYGPAGSDKLRIFLVEGDPATSADCLANLPSCGGATLGNWQTNTLYPIVDSAPVAELLGANNLPSFFLICPDHRVRVLTDWTLPGLTEAIENCPLPSQGIAVEMASFVTDYAETSVCGHQVMTPSLRLFNEGNVTVTQLEVELYQNNSLVQTSHFYPTLGSYQMETFTLEPVTAIGGTQLKAVVKKINETLPTSPVSGEQSFQSAEVAVNNDVTLRIRTDNFAVETYWEVTDLQGNVYAKGGNETVGPNGGGTGNVTAGNGTYANNATVVVPLPLPANRCYRLHVVDAFGDGLCSEGGYYRLLETNNALHILAEGHCNFTDQYHVFGVGDVTGTSDIFNVVPQLAVWPLPATNRIWVALPQEWSDDGAINWCLQTSSGVTVQSGQATPDGKSGLDIPIWNVPCGWYVLRLSASGRWGVAKVIVQRG